MKRLLPLLFFISNVCHAQNWQCLQYGVKHYFTNANGYLRGIRIDSVKTVGSDIVYYPFHTPRGSYEPYAGMPVVLDSNGASWLGKKVIQQNDGTFLFDNFLNDTIIIKTQANVGDVWVLYNDTADLYYQAKVIAIDSITILGTADSVKKILITAYDASGIVTSDPLDSFQIFFSKNSGFVQIFDLYTFPYHKPDTTYTVGLDYFLDKAANTLVAYVPQFTLAYNGINKKTQIFKLISLFNPSNEQLYEWNVGDVYEYSSCNGFLQWPTSICSPPSQYVTDTVNAKTSTSVNTQYSYTGIKNNLIVLSPPMVPPGPFIYTSSAHSGTFTYDRANIVDTTLMMEEFRQGYHSYYIPNDTSYCITSPLFIHNLSYIHGNSFYPPFEGPWVTNIYKHRLGLVHGYRTGMDWGFLINDQTLIYYNRGGATCGSFTVPPTKINDVKSGSCDIEIYPNPVTNILTITSNNKISQLTITNLIGHAIYTSIPNSDKVDVNVSSMPPGIYLVRINDSIVRKFVKE